MWAWLDCVCLHIQYSCDEDEDQVTIAVDSQELVCACSQAGEEV